MTFEAAASFRLAGVRWRPFRLPLRHRFEAAHAALEERAGVLVELLDEDGEVGVGEASPMPSLGDGTVEDVQGLLDEVAGSLLLYPQRTLESVPHGIPGSAAVRCALDTALLDLEARRRGVPIAHLLVSAPRKDVPVNAVLGNGTPEETRAFAKEAIAAGYRVLKLKVGVDSLDTDVASIEVVRAACPDATIRLDANGAWTEAGAREALERFAPLRIELVEQPVRASAWRALGRLKRTSPIRLAADEAVADAEAAEKLLEAGAADLVVLKPMRIGGIRPGLALARRAAREAIDCFVTTTFDSSIGIAAALHLAAMQPAGGPAEGLSTGDHLAADLVTSPLRPEGGQMALPPGAGLGVEVDYSALGELATGEWVERRA